VSKQKLVVLTGAGISAESGIKTFRDSDGLWENYRIEDVATPEAWNKNPKLVLDFYRLRHQQCIQALPNEAHKALAELQTYFDVQIITQNIDDLHERAGSKNIVHLHGEITKVCSQTVSENYIVPVKNQYIQIGDKSPKGYQLRPYIVWFGELVPKMNEAIMLAQQADIFLVVGTSLQVYPAAGLTQYAPYGASKFLIDPGHFETFQLHAFSQIRKTAVEGIKDFVKAILN
jgi:NAD-dependent deacetylase